MDMHFIINSNQGITQNISFLTLNNISSSNKTIKLIAFLHGITIDYIFLFLIDLK